jgi:hypothetical protein
MKYNETVEMTSEELEKIHTRGLLFISNNCKYGSSLGDTFVEKLHNVSLYKETK